MGVLLQIFLHRSRPKRDRQAWSGHARGGGNETHYHLDRSRSPTRTTWGIFQNQEGAIKDLPKTQRLYPNSEKFLDNISQLRYTLQMEEII